MAGLDLESRKAQFPNRIADEARLVVSDKSETMARRVAQFGVVAIIEGHQMRPLRTAEVARELDSTESTVYRHVPKPFIPTMLSWGMLALRELHYASRHAALTDYAAELALDEATKFDAKLKLWSELYGSVANPGELINAAMSSPHAAGALISEHARIINQNVSLLGLREGVQIPAALGISVLQVAAAHDMTYGSIRLAEATNIMAQTAIAIDKAA